MKRLLNEKFLYEGNSYFIKNINKTVELLQCNFCPFNVRSISGCIPTEIIKCYGRYEIVKND